MTRLDFQIDIATNKEHLWAILWSDETFRVWANYIDEGTYMVGGLIEGESVAFMSSVNGYGVKSLVKQVIPNEYVLFNHSADTMSFGQDLRENEWTGGSESYSLVPFEEGVHLLLTIEVPDHMTQLFMERQPQALQCIKDLAEDKAILS